MSLSILMYLTLVAVFAILAALAVRTRGIGALIMDPVVLGGGAVALIHGVMPILQETADFYRYQAGYQIQDATMAIVIVIIGSLCYFSILAITYRPRPTQIRFRELKGREARIFLLLSVSVFAIGAYCSFGNIRLILSMGVENYLKDRSSFGFGRGLLILLSHWTYVSCVIFLIGRNITRRGCGLYHFFSLMFLTSLCYTLLYYTLNSNRNSIFILVLNLIAITFLFRPELNKRFTMRQIRKSVWLGMAIVLAAGICFYIGSARRTHSISNYTITQSLNGAFGNHENIQWLASHGFEPKLGLSYLAAFTNFVPRRIWADKPFGGGPMLKNLIYPGSYIIGKDGNSSLTTGFFTEIYMNFGGWGFIPGCFAFAVLTSTLLRLLAKSKFLVFLSIFAQITLSTQLWYSEFLGLTVRFAISAIPFVAISITIRSLIVPTEVSPMESA